MPQDSRALHLGLVPSTLATFYEVINSVPPYRGNDRNLETALSKEGILVMRGKDY
jgi:hypothetical protein